MQGSRGVERSVDALSSPCADTVCHAHSSPGGEEGVLAACLRLCWMRDVHPACTMQTPYRALLTPLVRLHRCKGG